MTGITKTVAAAVVLVAAFVAPLSVQGETISEDDAGYVEARNVILGLFHDFLQMKWDGVFADHATIDTLGPDSFSNTIRGDNPPGGFFGRPPGSDWLERTKRAIHSYTTSYSVVCFEIPTLPTAVGSYSQVCHTDLMSLVNFIEDPIHLDWVAAKLWLATICHKTPEACNPYIEEGFRRMEEAMRRSGLLDD